MIVLMKRANIIQLVQPMLSQRKRSEIRQDILDGCPPVVRMRKVDGKYVPHKRIDNDTFWAIVESEDEQDHLNKSTLMARKISIQTLVDINCPSLKQKKGLQNVEGVSMNKRDSNDNKRDQQEEEE
jgi:hypothetical protein